MTTGTVNANETFTVRGTSYTIYQDHKTGFWSVANNLLVQSEDFTTTWVVDGSTVAANSIAAPDGTLTGDTLTEDGNNVNHSLTQDVSTITGVGFWTFSVHAKPNGRDHIVLVHQNASNSVTSVVFDVSTGDVTQQRTLNGTILDTNIEDAGDSWYRCTIVGDPTYDGSGDFVVLSLADSGTPRTGVLGRLAYQGDGSSGCYIWGAQLSDQASANVGYVATTTSTVTLPSGSEELLGKYTSRAELKKAIRGFGR